MRVANDSFHMYDVENMDAVAVLYQVGYLTISEYDVEEQEFVLDFPNVEVSTAFAKSLVGQYLSVPSDDAQALVKKLPKAFHSGDIEGAIDAMRSFLASIPYEIIAASESYYETAVFLIFKMLGLRCHAEIRTSYGRIDTLVETNDSVYCFEFKLDKSADEALRQIDSKEYLLPWAGSGKKLFKVGVAFDSKKRNIGEWRVEVC